MATDATTRAEINEVLDEFRTAVAAQDVGRLLSQFAPDADVVSIGTGAAEWYVGRDAMRDGLERDFDGASAFTVDFAPPIVTAVGDVAWLAAGFVVVGMAFLGYFAAHGRLEDLWLATIAYNLQYSRETYRGALHALGYLTFPINRARVDLLWYLGGVGVLVLIAAFRRHPFTWPLVGWSMPPTRLSSVVLPLPDGPIRAT